MASREYRIPFNRVSAAGNELAYIASVIQSGVTAASGDFTAACARELEEILQTHAVLLTTSGTHALEMCALLLDIRPGDEVIVPSFAFVSTAGAFASRGARPVFVDVRPDTLNLDERLVEAVITARTRGIVALHYGGVGCEMDELERISRAFEVSLVEDAAHALFGTFRGRKLGTFGRLAALSFHETKNVSCGEGGALVINDADLRDRARVIHQLGTDRQRFLEGGVDKYTWVDQGSSYAPSEILMAFLRAQLERRCEIQQRRREIWARYHRDLAQWARANDVRQPSVPPHCGQTYHIYHLVLPSADARRRFIEFLGERGILAVFHYQPLHLSRMGRSYGGQPGDCPVAEQLGACLVRLPLYAGLTEEEQGEVIAAVQDFECREDSA